MAIKVVTFAAYLTGTVSQMRDPDYAAQKFVKGLKGEPINGYARIRVRRTPRRLNNSNLDQAITWFGQMAADYLLSENESWPIALVPVPNSGSVLNGPEPRTLRLASAIKDNLKESSVADVFRWRERFPSAHQEGGTRNPATLFQNLIVVYEMPSVPIVLVDDVLTSGGHLQACAAWVWRKSGNLPMAICGGRTVDTQQADPFEVKLEEIDEFYP